MKILCAFFFGLFTLAGIAQTADQETRSINTTQPDDAYYAGETIRVNAPVRGDLVVAGGNLTFNDSIAGDLIAAGGEVFLNGFVTDDVRIAGGRIIVDAEIGDDLLVFGGEVVLTENAVVKGNLVCTGGKVEINGNVDGKLSAKGSEVIINGRAGGNSKIVAEKLTLGNEATFLGPVEYWTDAGEYNFGTALVNTQANFNEGLADEESELSLRTFGIASFFLWLFYIFSAFLVILLLHALFKSAFSEAAKLMEENWLKSFGIGLLYLLGIPIAILLILLLIVGIPLGIFLTTVFLFSILFGHLVAALLLTYYFMDKKGKNWGFWQVTFVALLFAIVLRLLTIIPFIGVVISMVVLAIAYGTLTLNVLYTKKLIART